MADPDAGGVGGGPPPQKWKAQRDFRERQRARLVTAESQNQELSASVVRLEKERVVLQAQIETLSKLLGSRWADGAEGGANGTGGGGGIGDRDVQHLQQQLTKRLEAADSERESLRLQRTEDTVRAGEFHALLAAEQAQRQALEVRNLELQNAAAAMVAEHEAARKVDGDRIRQLEATVCDLAERLVTQDHRLDALSAGHGQDSAQHAVRTPSETTHTRDRQDRSSSAERLTLTSQPSDSGEGSSNSEQALRFIELDDVAAAAMAELLKSMRGEGAVGTTTLECLRMTPATLRDIQREAFERFGQLLALGAEVEGSPAAQQMADHWTMYWRMMHMIWHGPAPVLSIMVRYMFEATGEPPPDVAVRAQAAFQLSNEQQEMVCDAYEALMAALEQAAADQDAFLAGRPQHPGALWIAQNASQLQKLSLRMLLILRDYYTAWPERILRPVQFIKAILAAAPWTVNTIAIGRDLAVRRGRMPEGEGRGMEEVLTWLFNDGSSSVIGADAESMSVVSLQDALKDFDDEVGDLSSAADVDPRSVQHADAAVSPMLASASS